MKKIWPLIVVVTLVLSGLGAVNAQEKEENLERNVNITFSQPSINVQNEYVELILEEGNSFLMDQGKPMLPINIQQFTFPFGTKIKSVTCVPKNIQIQTLTKEILPSPKIGVVGESVKNTVVNTIDYGTEPYPSDWYQYDAGCGIEGNERVIFLKVELYPVKYYPADNKIEWAGEFDINIEYEQIFKPAEVDQPYEFVIITPTDFQSQVASLVTHKNSRGISTKLVTLNEIYSGTHFPATGRRPVLRCSR